MDDEKEVENRLLQAALYYADLGYRVFPCKPDGKEPITTHGLLDASSDELKIREWWAETPDANIGLATDGLLVLDVDGADNPWILADDERLASLTGAPSQMTAGGGFHVFFKQPPGHNWRNTAGEIAENVDTRATGGYVVIAPSRIGDRLYRFQKHHELNSIPETLPEPPAWLCALLDDIAIRKSRPTKVDPAEPIPDGRRNNTLTSLAGSLRRIGFSEGAILGALMATNRERCQPPKEAWEVEKIARSIGSKEPDQIATALAEGGVYAAEAPDEDEKRPHPGAFPAALLEAGGLLGAVLRWNLETAMYPQPILGLAGALALMAAVTGRKVQDQYGTQTNLYVISIGPSGCGKEQARRVNKSVLKEANWEQLVAPEAIGSSAGLISAVQREPSSLFQVDEIGRFLRTLQNPDGQPHLYNVITVLMRLFSSSGQTYIGEAYADLERTKTIHWPHACLYGTTVPENFYGSLTRESLTDGFVARLLVFETEDARPEMKPAITQAVPAEILEAIGAWRDFNPGGNLNGQHPRPRQVVYSAGAEAMARALAVLCRQEEEDSRDGLGALWLRVVEKARKLAILHAASLAGPRVEQVGEESMAWACSLSEHLTRRLLNAAVDQVAENWFEELLNRVRRRIRRAGVKGMSKSQLIRAFQAVRQKVRDEILETLVETGTVVLERKRVGERGPERTVYVARENSDLAARLGAKTIHPDETIHP